MLVPNRGVSGQRRVTGVKSSGRGGEGGWGRINRLSLRAAGLISVVFRADCIMVFPWFSLKIVLKRARCVGSLKQE